MLYTLPNQVIYMYAVHCTMLSDPVNGMINCSLGDDGILSYEDVCTVTCDTGYMLTGDDKRTCQSDGIFDGTEAMCIRGKLYTNVLQSIQFILFSSLYNTF